MIAPHQRKAMTDTTATIPTQAHHCVTTAALLLLLIVTTPSSAHDVYMDWQRPGMGTMCCSGDPIAGDCYPTQARFIQGKWYALRREDKKWLAIPDKAVLTDVDNPDGRAHLCAPEPGKYLQKIDLVFCFNPPTLGM
jgi:hypothetical protein